MLENYQQRVFSHPLSKLNYKLVHPEEIKNKNKTYPTVSAMRGLYAYLTRRLDILPMFSSTKEIKVDIYPSWKIPALEEKTSFKYTPEWAASLEKDAPEIFRLGAFKEPEIPELYPNK
ncbi:hypothetical protein MHLP_02565 [Candidatus Mycoplasma haematolamae str. Purdue]|uniref:Uncharacterized protein n=1 Tax=Mycoplasma haematolamae (strain Purdue) TaxID=1212765 RepID=I7BJP8_MYCHA|nr:hypothetical protein MHLP_02565 [Candidatus Mycoplasma haematolamae str. Purdue]